jgi:ribonucleoside-diphosphate reductase alpha chain
LTATRTRLPNRRGHELIDFEHSGRSYTVGIGRFEDGRLAELFLNATKVGTDLETTGRGAAITASLALQYGCPVEVLRHALTRNSDGSAAGPIGTLLDLLGGPASSAVSAVVGALKGESTYHAHDPK